MMRKAGHSCDACGAEGARMRCTVCKSSYYCDRNCQRVAQKVHRKVCTKDRSMWPHIGVEMSVARVLSCCNENAHPNNARCKLCGKHDEFLIHGGCTCEESKAYLHTECLVDVARKYEEHAEEGSVWFECHQCHNEYSGTYICTRLALENWRFYRDRKDSPARTKACLTLSSMLHGMGEVASGHMLVRQAESSKFVSDEVEITSQLYQAEALTKCQDLSDPDEIIVSLRAVAEKSKQAEKPRLQIRALNTLCLLYLRLDQFDQAISAAVEYYLLAKEATGSESITTLSAYNIYARCLGCAGHDDAGKAISAEALGIATRVFGSDHPMSRELAETASYFQRR